MRIVCSALLVAGAALLGSSGAIAAPVNGGAIKAAADSWFAVPLPVKEIVTDMQIAHAAGGAGAATSLGFDVLAKVSSTLATPGAITGAPATGDAFVKGVLGPTNGTRQCIAVSRYFLPTTTAVQDSFA